MKRPSLYRATLLAVVVLFVGFFGYRLSQAAQQTRSFNLPSGACIRFSNGIKISSGAGAPSGGNTGDVYLRSDGTAGTTIYSRQGGTWKNAAICLGASPTIDFGSTAAQTSSESSGITITGAVLGDTVVVNYVSGSPPANCLVSGYVSSANTVTLRFNNYSSGTIDPANATFSVNVLRQ